jgi:hypothetical protein
LVCRVISLRLHGIVALLEENDNAISGAKLRHFDALGSLTGRAPTGRQAGRSYARFFFK